MDVMYMVGDRKVVRLMVMLLANLTQLDSGAKSLLQIKFEFLVVLIFYPFQEVLFQLEILEGNVLSVSDDFPNRSEFVGEFWKVLPAAVKVVMENGDDHGKNVVSRLKLSIGGTAEKIVSALHTVLSKHPDEDTDLERCKNAVRRLEKMEKDVEVACARGSKNILLLSRIVKIYLVSMNILL
ncbi:uncharacterized protein A4U43_C07F24710 [Asparagus officinalis]|uniref:Uncharacterized protein n=1 Tax=Asparagus officinalis TaxID=4686 RepID=A0A5P1EEY9_ASPOF|nr:uncharacterized protein A4U43_C07F24710 [Asparagus officinalis]